MVIVAVVAAPKLSVAVALMVCNPREISCPCQMTEQAVPRQVCRTLPFVEMTMDAMPFALAAETAMLTLEFPFKVVPSTGERKVTTGAAEVVTDTGAECGEFPTALYAQTVYAYVTLAASPVSAKVVLVV